MGFYVLILMVFTALCMALLRSGYSTLLPLRLPQLFLAALGANLGSGFVNGNGPAHLPPHTSAALGVGKSFGERWSVSVNSTNLFNHRFMLDDSNTFGGTHFANPR